MAVAPLQFYPQFGIQFVLQKMLTHNNWIYMLR